MWRTREECMTAESGLDCMPGSEGDVELLKTTSEVCNFITVWVAVAKEVYLRILRAQNLCQTLRYWMRRSWKLSQQ